MPTNNSTNPGATEIFRMPPPTPRSPTSWVRIVRRIPLSPS